MEEIRTDVWLGLTKFKAFPAISIMAPQDAKTTQQDNGYKRMHIPIQEAMDLIAGCISEPFCTIEYGKTYENVLRRQHKQPVRVVTEEPPKVLSEYPLIVREGDNGYPVVLWMERGSFRFNILDPDDVIKFPRTQLALVLTGEPEPQSYRHPD